MWWLEITLDYSLLLPAVERQPFTWCTIKKPSDKIFKIHTETPVPESQTVMLSTKLNGLKPAAFKTRLNESCFHNILNYTKFFNAIFLLQNSSGQTFSWLFSLISWKRPAKNLFSFTIFRTCHSTDNITLEVSIA